MARNDHHKEAAEFMIASLKNNNLDVTLIPAPDSKHPGHMIRAAQNRNPAWYRELCDQYPSNRSRPRQRLAKYSDTLIKRKSVINALEEIAAGGKQTTYTLRLLQFVERIAAWLLDPNPKELHDPQAD